MIQTSMFPKKLFYKNTYFIYNISMNVKSDLTRIKQLREVLKKRQGLLLTSDLADLGIPRTYLSIMEKQGEIERVSWGVYRAADTFIEDELFGFQSRHKSSIFSHETALYLHDLTDRSPLTYSITVPSGYHSPILKASGYKVFYVKRDLVGLGVTTLNTSHNNPVWTTDLERTICDIVRSRNQVDVQIRSEAMKRYASHKLRNITLLLKYAEHFNVQKILREYMEILL